jgi:hypothetical protein
LKQLAKIITIFLIHFQSCFCSAQVFPTDKILNFPLMSADEVSTSLENSGWKKHNIEFVPDSNFVRRSWELSNRKGEPKSYFLYYELISDSAENYIIYQFSDRNAFVTYKKELKSHGYKLMPAEKSNKKRRKGEEISKDVEDFFYLDSSRSLVVVKETFYYGLFSFLIYVYRPNSAFAQLELQRNKK